MLNLAQVNVALGNTPATQLGLIYMILGAVYLVCWIVWLKSKATINNTFICQIIQTILVTLALELCGFLMLYHGWRLDPLLQFSQVLLFLLLLYFIIRDSLSQMLNRN
ncbi:hypothetical protein NIES4071_107780 (plasmid) [Calothrix sp. NIES-4071]|nr:hypothetical protein NIES4071_107780 [Calothrix sp. NIES-4071]BAZ64818.1 hypothetical protein NIES4105_105510 [Calothrix sp. NIES-4105]